MGFPSEYYLKPDMTMTHRVSFVVNQGNRQLGTIVLGLFGNVAPKTVRNFVEIASGGQPKEVRRNSFPQSYPELYAARSVPIQFNKKSILDEPNRQYFRAELNRYIVDQKIMYEQARLLFCMHVKYIK
ncbi:peptidyl-prolyl cis-trans isomerase B-like, partial [Tropilaelaps mercedesae]